ncbi:hypothetical protein ACLK1T_22215 [Escherichia coli]
MRQYYSDLLWSVKTREGWVIFM